MDIILSIENSDKLQNADKLENADKLDSRQQFRF